MAVSRIIGPVVAIVILVGGSLASEVRAGPLDGVAGAAVGFALGAMVAGSARPAPVYAAPQPRRVIVYRERRVAPRRYAAAPARRRAASPVTGAAISTASDPFAGSGGARPIPVSGR